MRQLGYERLRDRDQRLDSALSKIVSDRAERRRESLRMSHCIHTTDDSMTRYGTGFRDRGVTDDGFR